MLALVGDLSGPSLWRVLWPITALEKLEYPCGWDFKDAAGIGAVAAAFDGLVLPRLSWAPSERHLAERWFGMLRRAGKLCVFDADDDLFSPELDRRSVILGWADGKSADELEAERQMRIWAVQQCDGVTVSTRRLATLVRTLTDRPVVVVPNAIDLPWFRRVLRAAPGRSGASGAVTVGWAGGKRPDDDLLPMAEAWGRVAARFPEVRFVVGGYLPPVITERVPADRLTVIPWLPLERYPQGLVGIDVACAAVADTPFNRCKCVEYSMRITTNRGVVPAGSITPGMRVWRDGWRAVIAVSHEVPRPGVQITTRRGYRLRLTPEHRMMVDGEWKRAADIRPGDCMLMEPEHTPVCRPARVNWPADSRMSRAGRGGGATFDPKAFLDASDGPKLDITPRWGRFLGAWAGDGSCGQSTVAQISCDGQDQDWIDLLTDDLRAFGLNPTTEQLTTFNGTVLRRRGIRVASAHLLRVLESIGVARPRDNGTPIRVTCVPEVIWRSPQDVIREFLAGYFEADGTLSDTSVTAVSKDEQLLRDVQRLLLLFGITCVLRSRIGRAQNGFTGTYWMLVLRRAEADVFAREIGFRSARKRARLDAMVGKTHSNAYRPIAWECEVDEVVPCMVTPIDLQVEGETFVLAGFVSHNSTIKAVESAVAGACVVATPTVYGALVEHGLTGYLAETVDEWEAALVDLVERPAARSIMARRLLRVVERQHTLAGNLHRWPKAWQRIADDAGARRGRLVAV